MLGPDVEALRTVDGSEPLGPAHIHLTVWFDRPPEIYAPGLAPWLVLAALYEAADALATEEDPAEGPEEEEA